MASRGTLSPLTGIFNPIEEWRQGKSLNEQLRIRVLQNDDGVLGSRKVHYALSPR